MSRIWACILVCVSLSVLPQSTNQAKILVLTPFGSRTVRALFWEVSGALAEHGHHVTLIAGGDVPLNRHNNVTHLVAPHSGLDQMDLFEVRKDGTAFRMLVRALPHVATELYDDPNIMSVWNKRHEFDAIIINSAVNEMAFPFLLGTTKPFITLSPTGTEPLQLSYLGNLVSPAALPSVILPYSDTLTLYERVVNTVATFALRYVFRRGVFGPLFSALRVKFPELPDPLTMYPKQSLALLNRHHLLDGAIPLLPNQVEIGCLTCRQPRPMSQELEKWLDMDGDVIYFSLGSLQQASRVPSQYTQILFSAFAELPCRVLAKYAPLNFPQPDNVRIEDWVPQQDVLAHSNVKVFITHCGKNSAGESMYHGVPMVGLPITNDHPRTCARLWRRGEALVLQWETLNKEDLVKAITTLLTDSKYRERVEGVSKRLKAQKETGLERAVWWIEYTIQHGDTYLRFSGADLSLAQYLLLDVLVILLVALCVILLPLYLLIRAIYRRCFPQTQCKTKVQ